MLIIKGSQCFVNSLFFCLILKEPSILVCLSFCCSCSVCLGEYKTEDKLQKIPSCGHVFHLDCIDHWLSNHNTCPLCRLSVLSPSSQPPHIQIDMGLESSNEPQCEEAPPPPSTQACQHTTPPV